MKWLASFLAILVLALSVQPACASPIGAAAADACCATNGYEEPGRSENEDTEKGGCHGCNPFESTCGCCALGVILPQQTVLLPTLPLVHEARTWSPAVPTFPAAVYGDFWQPPKIG